jgi:hypothetical protein
VPVTDNFGFMLGLLCVSIGMSVAWFVHLYFKEKIGQQRWQDKPVLRGVMRGGASVTTALRGKQLTIVEQLERRVELTRDLMNDWLLFIEILNKYPNGGTNKPKLEAAFLKLVGDLARKQRVLRDALQADYGIDGNLMNIVSSATDLESVYAQSEVAVKKLTLEWHQVFISINETLGVLEDKKARAEAGEKVLLAALPMAGGVSNGHKKNQTNNDTGNTVSAAQNVGIGIIALAWIAAWILGLVIHVWTIMISFAVSGLFAAVLTLALPVLSEIYWFSTVGSNLGFGTVYCVSVMAYVGLLCVPFLGAAFAGTEK